MLSSTLVLSIFGVAYIVAAQSTTDPFAVSTCTLTCSAKADRLVCNDTANDTDSEAADDCFCTNKDARSQFSACLDATCAAQKDAAETIRDTLCNADESNGFDCLDTCSGTLVPPINATCTDPDTQDECACKSQPIQDGLKSCFQTTCANIADATLTLSNIVCSIVLNGFNDTDAIGDIPGVGAGGNSSSPAKPSTGAPSGGNKTNSTGSMPEGAGAGNSAALVRGGYVCPLLLVAAILSIVV
ncbi:hypothetical protein AURDEDRAFT_174149 [Auricularia subglabra TFB-10046 SS5]|nr:hypothetical protein AURDEDRAFT_174149 [Auricularia subglabra TFB-10046 SS5]